MNIENLKFFDIDEKYIQRLKIEKLYDYQREILEKGLLNESLVLSAPTNSGKTLIAIIAIAKELQKNSKAVYIAPLVSLANEKYEELKNIFFDKKVALSVGDYDSADSYLAYYDLIVTTPEKLDSLIRHEAEWIYDIKLIVFDEIHLLADYNRGANSEFLLTKLKFLIPNAKIIALSATIKNAEEIAKWLNANCYKTNFRPIPLYEGVFYKNKIILKDKEIEIESEELEGLVKYVLNKGKQILIFAPTRKQAESLAKKLSEITKYYVNENLSELSKQILNVLETPTKQCKELAELVKKGAAFHHAGLLFKQRNLIEKAFKEGKIKLIISTTTLAFGLNLPSFCVLIYSLKRKEGAKSYYIPVLEEKQMVGRAGRIPYDNFGFGLLYAKSESEKEFLFKKYVLGEIEEIYSNIGNDVVLRSHLLSLIATNFANDLKSIKSFFKKTFFYHQTKNWKFLKEKILKWLKKLIEWKFVKIENKKLIATRIGKRVSELYIDPLSANILIEGIKRFSNHDEFSLLSLISNCTEMKFLVSVRESEIENLTKIYYKNKDKFLFEVPEEFDIEFEYFLNTLKLTLVLQDWINEETEEKIFEKYKIAPGELRVILDNADWLLYSMQELCILIGKLDVLKKIRKLRIRIKYGIKEELIELIRIEGIGRVKARKLYNSGIKDILTLKKVPLITLEILLGPKTARKVKEIIEDENKLNQKILKDFGFKYEDII